MASKRDFVPNQIFVGLPWKTVRPKYERCLEKLHKKHPVYFTIVGKDDDQTSEDLFSVILDRIRTSSFGVFDATSGNANVSLEFGFAEGIDLPKAIFISAHKASHKSTAASPIISDLSGKRRVQYTNENTLLKALEKLAESHAFSKRFDTIVSKMTKRKSPKVKNAIRKLALEVIREFDGKPSQRRAALVQNLKGKNFSESDIEPVLKELHKARIVVCTQGRFSDAYLT